MSNDCTFSCNVLVSGKSCYISEICPPNDLLPSFGNHCNTQPRALWTCRLEPLRLVSGSSYKRRPELGSSRCCCAREKYPHPFCASIESLGVSIWLVENIPINRCGPYRAQPSESKSFSMDVLSTVICIETSRLYATLKHLLWTFSHCRNLGSAVLHRTF